MNTFLKIRFTSPAQGSTAGLVLDTDKFNALSIQDISRMFPYSEALKMKRLQASRNYPTWVEAFAHEFEPN